MSDSIYNTPVTLNLAPYACKDEESRGRQVAEAPDPSRPDFMRDAGRISHSSYYRRLDKKTQVLTSMSRNDHTRSRLTHSNEVAQLARDAAWALGLNPFLTQAIAQAHDIGHPPFGHRGDEVLNSLMQPYGGFEHNAQAIRIVTKLARYKTNPTYPGLNLTWETLEGIAKHNGPVAIAPWALATYNDAHDLELGTHASGEAQMAAICDDIAYNNHDIEDGIDGKFFTLQDIKALPVLGDIAQRLHHTQPNADLRSLIVELRRDGINAMIQDMLTQTRANFAEAGIQSVDDIRSHNSQLVTFSAEMTSAIGKIRAFLAERMYRAPSIQKELKKAESALTFLFEHYMSDPTRLPAEWRKQTEGKGHDATARTVCDYIAGMTDHFAWKTYKNLQKQERER